MPTLEWIGKDKVINHHQEVPYRLLDEKYTYNAEISENKIIHGDNLLALKSLLPEYEGRIDCIYIDPPYNTGNEKWVYNDNVNDPKIKKWLGEVVGAEGEDLSRHDKWLCMMYPRLKLLHKLLSDKGAIFISIDDNEQANLKLICDEIFGSSNFIANIVWKKKTNGNNMGLISPVHDFIIVYAKNINHIEIKGVPLSKNYLTTKYSNPDNDPRGEWTTTDLSANHKGPYFPIVNPNTGEKFFPPKGRYWVFNEVEVQKRIESGRIIFGKTGKTQPVQKAFMNDRKLTVNPQTWFDEQGYNSDGMKQLFSIFGNKVLDHPKPSSLIEYILSFASNPNAIILDSFAGSGTTAHAVLNMNKQDGGNRKFILVEMMDYAETITAERVKRVIDGYGEGDKAVEGTNGSFSYCKLGAPVFKDDKNLNEEIGKVEIRKYVYFMETKQRLATDFDDNRYFMGKHNATAFYFFYEKEEITTLNTEFLSTVKTKADGYVIYADKCVLSNKFMSNNGIVFKKIPRDIARL